MDSNNGNIAEADLEFERNVKIFEKNNFPVNTTCQHGNPVMKELGIVLIEIFFVILLYQKNIKILQRLWSI